MKTISCYSRTLPALAATLFTTNLASAATILWNGASGTDTNWSTAANWIGGVVPASADDVKFYDDGADATVSNVNNVVNGAFAGSVLSLQYGNTNNFHTTLIESGKTLTVLGNLSVATDTDNGSAQSVFATITGPGAKLVLSNTAANLIVRQGSANSGSSLRATLDLSGVDTFSATIGRMLIGSETANPAGGPRPAGTLYLARTNTIVASGAAPAIAIGGIGGNNNNGGNSSFINLGYTNAIFADSIRVGRGKQGGNSSIVFNPAFISENPAAYFRGANQVGRVSAWNIADSEGIGGTVNTRGFDDFTGGRVDALVDTMLVGRSSTGTGAGSPAGTLTFALGTIDVNNLQVGIQGASGA